MAPRPPPDLKRTERTVWAMRQIEFATGEGEIRAAMRVLMQGPKELPRSFILKL